ncbi:hypothetical protein DL238_03450 [Alteriqipengyuania lutimaris]|uniref:Uncharacterized protein n=2 Tax=Alteriqipengyuania lutimaris TaxID=1538146 RepID=A0A395LIF6_9SPHN|nr:hypothetical protein DL238_03450 [Alteriqipengyuania lutimaris]
MFAIASAARAQTQEEQPADTFVTDAIERSAVPISPEDLDEPVTIEEMEEQALRETLRESAGRSVETAGDDVGERLEASDTDAISPIARIDNRIENRVRNRLQTRIDRNADTSADTTSAIERADRRTRDTSRAQSPR